MTQHERHCCGSGGERKEPPRGRGGAAGCPARFLLSTRGLGKNLRDPCYEHARIVRENCLAFRKPNYTGTERTEQRL